MIPFTWETDRSKSYESFWECYQAWEKKAEEDPSIDLGTVFPTKIYDSEGGRRHRRGGRGQRTRVRDIRMIVGLEDELKCSGMCRPSLFYFGRNITEDGYPKDTCLHQLRKYMLENGVPYTTCCTLLTLTALWLSIISFCLMRKDREPGEAH